MYYPDMSIYSYSNFDKKLKEMYNLGEEFVFLNIGWIDSSMEYEKAEKNEEFLKKMLILIKKSGNMMRGYHRCQYCLKDRMIGNEYDLICVKEGDSTITLGSREIYFQYGNFVFISPDLIYHYIENHSYKPPDLYYDAVMKSIV
jgi:hypothetical protein